MGRALPTLEIEGEYWLSEAGAVRATSSKNKMALLPSFAQTLTEAPMTEALLSSLVKKMAKTKGFPLASRVTLKIQSPQRPSAPQPDEPESDAPEPVVITTTVQSITEEPLDERLFQVPEDYQKVEPPSLRPRPGPPRPGEADGPPKDPSSW
jgi:hypothetical protein